MKTALVVADLSNLYYCTHSKFKGRRLDYKKFLQSAVDGFQNYSAVAYGSEFRSSGMVHFKNALANMGFELRFKPIKVYKGREPGKETRKLDWDVGITVEVMERKDQFDTLILGSADGDMVPLVQHLLKSGKKVHVIASGISRDLRETANSYTEITSDLLED